MAVLAVSEVTTGSRTVELQISWKKQWAQTGVRTSGVEWVRLFGVGIQVEDHFYGEPELGGEWRESGGHLAIALDND